MREQLTLDLLDGPAAETVSGPTGHPPDEVEGVDEGVTLLRGWALAMESELLSALRMVIRAAPFRHLVTPGGQTMSVAMTNCGRYGWVSDRHGYRYTTQDPHSGLPWPAMPTTLRGLARDAAARGGFADYEPNACLVNRYTPGARLSLHQDKDERDFDAPIVSLSLGLPAIFLLGGLTRKERARRIPLRHGDVIVWGGTARLRYHGVLPIKEGHHPRLGPNRLNITFRRAR